VVVAATSATTSTTSRGDEVFTNIIVSCFVVLFCELPNYSIDRNAQNNGNEYSIAVCYLFATLIDISRYCEASAQEDNYNTVTVIQLF